MKKLFLKFLFCLLLTQTAFGAENKKNLDKFFSSIMKGNLKEVQTAIKKGISVNARDTNSWTALHYASHLSPNLKVLRFLLKEKARTESIDKHSKTALHWACRHGNLKAAKILIKNKANLEAKDNYGHTPLHLASNSGKTQLVKLLIKNKAKKNPINSLGNTPLHLAVKSGHNKTVKTLLKEKVKIDQANDMEFTPLHTASFFKKTATLKILTRYEKSLNAKDEKRHWTALHYSTLYRNKEMVGTLLKHGASPNVKSTTNITPLHIAVSLNSLAISKLLIIYGASFHTQNQEGKTPLRLVIEKPDSSPIKRCFQDWAAAYNSQKRIKLIKKWLDSEEHQYVKRSIRHALLTLKKIYSPKKEKK